MFWEQALDCFRKTEKMKDKQGMEEELRTYYHTVTETSIAV